MFDIYSILLDNFNLVSSDKHILYFYYFFRGSAIAKIVGNNALEHKHLDEKVTMYVYEEIINGKKLTEIINETHENIKYLPGHKLPPNVVSNLQNHKPDIFFWVPFFTMKTKIKYIYVIKTFDYLRKPYALVGP